VKSIENYIARKFAQPDVKRPTPRAVSHYQRGPRQKPNPQLPDVPRRKRQLATVDTP
jgi:hypothetical protein